MCLVAQLCNPMDCACHSPLSMVILQARILEWVAMPSSRGSSWTRDQPRVSYVSCIGRWVLYHSRHLGSPSAWQWLIKSLAIGDWLHLQPPLFLGGWGVRLGSPGSQFMSKAIQEPQPPVVAQTGLLERDLLGITKDTHFTFLLSSSFRNWKQN